MILYRNDKDFNKFYSKFEKEDYFPPFYTDESLKYYLDKEIENNKTVKDKSFIILENNIPICIFIGFLIKSASNTMLSVGEAPSTLYMPKINYSKKIKKKIIEEFTYFYSNKFKINFQDHLYNNNLNPISEYLIKEIQYQINLNQIIHLDQNTDKIKLNIRKSYKSLINISKKNLSIKIYDYKNTNINILNSFRNLHTEQAGRQTRSEQSWKNHLNAIFQKKGFLIYGFIKSELVTAALFLNNDNTVYYGVSASKRSMFKNPLSHSIIWTAINYSKELGFKYFDLGNIYENIEKKIDSKINNINKFKTGFGGVKKISLVFKNYE